MNRLNIRLAFCLLLSGIAHATWASSPVTFADETYVTKTARIWTEPSKFGEAIALLTAGVHLKVSSYSTTGAWAKVITPAGREGWIPVRFTTLNGRREKPLIQGQPLESVEADNLSGGTRAPSSLPVEASSESAVADAAPSDSAASAFEVGAGYINQLSRGSGSGLLLDLRYYQKATPRLSYYFGLSYVYAKESSSVTVATTTIQSSRSSSELLPSIGLRLTYEQFFIGFGLGLVHDSSSYETRDASTGEVIFTNPVTGLVATGSQSGNLLLVSLDPSYSIALSPGNALNVGLSYQMYLDLTDGTGVFDGQASSKAQHNLGLKLSYLSSF